MQLYKEKIWKGDYFGPVPYLVQTVKSSWRNVVKVELEIALPIIYEEELLNS